MISFDSSKFNSFYCFFATAHHVMISACKSRLCVYKSFLLRFCDLLKVFGEEIRREGANWCFLPLTNIFWQKQTHASKQNRILTKIDWPGNYLRNSLSLCVNCFSVMIYDVHERALFLAFQITFSFLLLNSLFYWNVLYNIMKILLVL